MSLKGLLKGAREAIEGEEYSAALRICDTALNQQPAPEGTTLYTILIFRALALQNLQHWKEAIAIYEEARNISPENPLAWQVLSPFVALMMDLLTECYCATP